jgi:hypothetical protein
LIQTINEKKERISIRKFKNLLQYWRDYKKAINFELSLSLFKPKFIDDFIIEPIEREWNEEIIWKIENNIKQPALFDFEEEKLAKETFRSVKKLTL